MNSRFASALLVIAAASLPAQPQRLSKGDSVIVANALNSVRTFQRGWEREWLAGMRARNGRMNQLDSGVKIVGDPTINIPPRVRELHCFFGLDAMNEKQVVTSPHAWGIPIEQRAIHSSVNINHWVCPNWLPPDDFYLSGPRLPDERLFIDFALEPSARRGIVDSRDTLIKKLGAAVARAPRDSVLLGQYVRMMVDNGKTTNAINALDNCLASGTWCNALRGFVQSKLGQMFDAEDSYLIAIDSLSTADRCAWTNIAVLLPEDARKEYGRMPCTVQDSINRTVWWLADPLWSIPGNDRFVEQFSRKVLIALHAGLGRDERYNWMPQAGGDAMRELVERYGWASFAAFDPYYTLRHLPPRDGAYGPAPKDSTERRISQSLGGRRTTFEYSLGRVHVIPPMSMVKDPFSITNADWSMNAPGGGSDFTFNWWPVEHYAPINPIVKIVDQQTAFLRRQDSTLIAYATNLARTDLARRLGDSVQGVMLTSPRPGAIRRLDDKVVGAQSRLTFLSALPREPSLVSVEIPWNDKGERGGRSRFGVKPPAPLSAMSRGDIAMSDPVILVIPPNATALPNVADSAIALMNGSTTLAAGTSSVGVYWETYGIAAGDSVELTVTLQPRGGGSPVTTSWREPQPGRVVRNVAGAVPIQMRSLILDVGAIPVGAYLLELSVRRGTQLVRSSRELTIR